MYNVEDCSIIDTFCFHVFIDDDFLKVIEEDKELTEKFESLLTYIRLKEEQRIQEIFNLVFRDDKIMIIGEDEDESVNENETK